VGSASARPSAATTSGTTSRSSSGSTFSGGGGSTNVVATPGAVNRSRDGRPIVGMAAARPADSIIGFGALSPFGLWSPLYYSGFGYHLGFYSYNPWFYGSTPWMWGRYGLWYDPWAVYPYDSYYYPHYYGGSSGYASEPDSRPVKAEMGSIRIKANAKSAKVYVDGTLMGTAEEFAGFSHHLELGPGGHQLELRADGFQPVIKDIMVLAGKTTTERVSLKKK
jgi:PEGA domain-containing protein